MEISNQSRDQLPEHFRSAVASTSAQRIQFTGNIFTWNTNGSEILDVFQSPFVVMVISSPEKHYHLRLLFVYLIIAVLRYTLRNQVKHVGLDVI